MLILFLVAALLAPQPAPTRSAQAADIDVVQFAGTVTRGQAFERPIGRDLVFRLDPHAEGRRLYVVIRKPEDEHREACEPLHGGSQCDFLGEYFTPDSTAWGYLKSRVREFRIGLGALKPSADEQRRANPDWWRAPEYEAWGTGRLTIEDVKVGVDAHTDAPWINSMRFRVDLRLPKYPPPQGRPNVERVDQS